MVTARNRALPRNLFTSPLRNWVSEFAIVVFLLFLPACKPGNNEPVSPGAEQGAGTFEGF